MDCFSTLEFIRNLMVVPLRHKISFSRWIKLKCGGEHILCLDDPLYSHFKEDSLSEGYLSSVLRLSSLLVPMVITAAGSDAVIMTGSDAVIADPVPSLPLALTANILAHSIVKVLQGRIFLRCREQWWRRGEAIEENMGAVFPRTTSFTPFQLCIPHNSPELCLVSADISWRTLKVGPQT